MVMTTGFSEKRVFCYRWKYDRVGRSKFLQRGQFLLYAGVEVWLSTQVLEERTLLPVKKFEDEILDAISQNSVVIVRGATGCGKTTQVPQFILDDFIQSGRAAECNIVVTQVSRTPAWRPSSALPSA